MHPLSRRRFLGAGIALLATACSSGSTSAPPTTDDAATSTAATPTTTSVAATSTTEAATTTDATTTTGATTPTTTAVTSTTTPAPVEFGDPFTLGVASGDPDTAGVVLWTRLAPEPLATGGGMPDRDVEVRWEVAASESFATVLSAGGALAAAADAHSVHVVVPLDADAEHWYRFRVGQHVSPVGRTRRAPSGRVDQLTFASASCQNYEAGFYAAHRDLAARAPAFVVWLGDYIYEAAAGAYGDAAVRSHGTAEAADLDGYRLRYARYKTDADLQAAHRACPWFVVWDDHEVTNNYAGLTSADPSFAARRAAAYRAWWEHQPVRLPAPTVLDDDPTAEYRIHRDARWGDLLGLALVDGRQYRSAQACAGPTAATACAGLDDPARTMLGAAQEQWLATTFGTWGTTWNVLGNQTVVSAMRPAGTVLNPDQWDGYPAARERLLQTLAGAGDVVVLTGDIHAALVGRVHLGDRSVAVELVSTSISTGSAIAAAYQPLLRLLPDIVDAELAHRGYFLHTVSPTEWVAELRLVDDARRQDSAVSAGNRYRITAGTNTAHRI